MYLFFKRSFDIVSSLLVIFLLAPVWLTIAIGIKFSSPGPVFYTSKRSGINHKEFLLYKFRTMHVLQTPKELLPDDKKEARFIANENRIFKFGGFLRKSKLDELPQLFNVLCGQMTLVGPRPYPDKAVKKFYIGEYECVTQIKPGLACLDSLYDYAHGELFVDTDKEYIENILPVRTELAKMYADNMGVYLDAYCIFRTVQLIFKITVLKKQKFEYTRYERAAINKLFGKVPAVS